VSGGLFSELLPRLTKNLVGERFWVRSYHGQSTIHRFSGRTRSHFPFRYRQELFIRRAFSPEDKINNRLKNSDSKVSSGRVLSIKILRQRVELIEIIVGAAKLCISLVIRIRNNSCLTAIEKRQIALTHSLITLCQLDVLGFSKDFNM